MIRNIAVQQQIETLINRVEDSSLSQSAHVRITPDLEVHITRLNWREYVELDSESLQYTASKIMELASEKFFSDLCIRFGAIVEEDSSLGRHSLSQMSGKLRKCPIEAEQLQTLRRLSEGMVQRIAQIHGLVPERVVRETHSLEVSNVKKFLNRLSQEALDVYGLYLSDSDIQDRYYEMKNDPKVSVKEMINFLNKDLAKASIDIRVPIEHASYDTPHFSEVMSFEFFTAEIIYRLPLVSKEERDAFKIKMYVQGHGLVTYRIHSEIDFWNGLLAYRLTPIDKEEAPDIISIRGTQRKRGLYGFLGSMIAVWHPLGPGGNALIGNEAKKLIQNIEQGEKRVILSGHSMGAEIALTLHKKIEPWVERTYSFNNPGRNKHHMNIHTPVSHVYHFINASDPVSYLGDFRDGQVNMIYSTEKPIPSGVREMLAQSSDIILNNHCSSQTLGKRSWMAVSVKPGAALGDFNPAWGFLHRLTSNTLYGPWKMIALISSIVLPIFYKLTVDIALSVQQLYQWLRRSFIWQRETPLENPCRPSRFLATA